MAGGGNGAVAGRRHTSSSTSSKSVLPKIVGAPRPGFVERLACLPSRVLSPPERVELLNAASPPLTNQAPGLSGTPESRPLLQGRETKAS